ncbi:MAG: DUF86 domain-containing protein [Bacteroidetes bacterium]|nr:DUF86 domain-containing protein [Bacteroidota bacterium]
MTKDIKAYYEDIEFSIERIEQHLAGITSFAAFKAAITVYDAVERRLAIIGEALWKIDKLEKSAPITDKQKIIGLRHILIHDYDLVSPEIIWMILEKTFRY